MLLFRAGNGIDKDIIIDGVVDQTSETLPRLNQNAGVIILAAAFAAEFLQFVLEVSPAMVRR